MSSKITPNRYKMLLTKYLEAKITGLQNQFDIIAIDDSLEHYMITFRPMAGLYRDQTHVLELRTSHGSNESQQYPQDPPNLQFHTKNFHTNISPQGSICVDFIYNRKQWLPTYTFVHIIQAIQLLYMTPENGGSHLNGLATQKYNECLKEYKDAVVGVTDFAAREAIFDTCFLPFKTQADAIWQSGPSYTTYTAQFAGLSETPPRCWPLASEVAALEAQYENIAGKKALVRLRASLAPQISAIPADQKNTSAVSVEKKTETIVPSEAPNQSSAQLVEQAAPQVNAAPKPLTAEERAARLRRAPKPKK